MTYLKKLVQLDKAERAAKARNDGTREKILARRRALAHKEARKRHGDDWDMKQYQSRKWQS